MDVCFQQAQLVHAPICAELDALSFATNNFPLSTIEQLLNQPNVIGLLTTLPNDTPIGYSLCAVGGGVADILTICIIPQYQGKGLGKTLMAQTLSALKQAQVEDVFLEVRKSNTAAIQLYQNFGGSIVGERKNYYKDEETGLSEDAYVFKLQI